MFRKLSFLLLVALLISACADAGDPTATNAEPTVPSLARVEPTHTAPASAATAYPEPPPAVVPTLIDPADYPSPAPLPTIPAADYPEPGETEPSGANPAEENPQCTGNVDVINDYTVEAADGLMISGDLYLPEAEQPLPGLVLTHMLSRDRTVWENFPEELAQNCYVVLNIDLRGHGKTGGQVDWPAAVEDVKLVAAHLGERDEVDAERIGLLGASIGANVALNAAADLPEVRSVVLLSPGLDYAGLTTPDALAQYGERPLLIAASDGDTYAAESSSTLDSQALGTHRLIMYTGTAHGTDMFAVEPNLKAEILAWLEATVQ
jgi:pimeloyl-ACP methyl ester carboxylesterase